MYLRTVLSEGSGFDPRAPGRLALPRSLAAAVGDHLRVLPPETRAILEMLVGPQPAHAASPAGPGGAGRLAQRGDRAGRGRRPGGLVARRAKRARSRSATCWSGTPSTPALPLPGAACCTPAPPPWSASRRRGSTGWPPWSTPMRTWPLSWSAWPARRRPSGRLALAATHLRWASDISPARADRERRLLTAALHLMLAEESRGLALRHGGGGVGAVAAAQLRAGHDGVLVRPARPRPSCGSAKRWRRRGTDPDSQPLAALIANRLAGTYTLLGDGEKVQTFGRWALGTGCLDAAAASQTRTLIAIGASQVAGPREALAELGHLDADPARVGPVDVDGLSFRGVFQLLAGDLGQAVHDLTASLEAGPPGRHPHPGPARLLLPGAGPVPGRRVGRRAAHRRAGVLGRRRSMPAATNCRCCTWRRAACRPDGARPRRPNGTPGWPRRRRPAWTTARSDCTRRWPGPWCARRPVTTWAWPTRWVPGATTRPWTAAAGRTRCCGGRCWPRA